MKAIFYRYYIKHTETHDTLDDCIRSLYWIAEGGHGSPEAITEDDGTVVLQGRALSDAYWAWGREHDDR